MTPTEKFKEFAGKFISIEQAHTTVYVPADGEYDEDSILPTVESYHPMEELEDGQVVVALCFTGRDKNSPASGFVAVDDEQDLAWVYAEGNDEPIAAPASKLGLELASD